MEAMALLLAGSTQEVLDYLLQLLLFVGPLLIMIGAMLPPRRGRPFLVAALASLGVETALFFLPPLPGKDLVSSSSYATSMIVRLDASGILFETKAMFLGLFAIYIVVLCIPFFLHRLESRLFSTALPLSFLVLYSAGTLFW